MAAAQTEIAELEARMAEAEQRAKETPAFWKARLEEATARATELNAEVLAARDKLASDLADATALLADAQVETAAAMEAFVNSCSHERACRARWVSLWESARNAGLEPGPRLPNIGTRASGDRRLHHLVQSARDAFHGL